MPRKSSRSPNRVARDLGNVEEGAQLPASLARRQVRRTSYRRTKSALANLLRMLELVGKGRR